MNANANQKRVALSQFHSGQIVTPIIEAWTHRGGCTVELSWFDASDHTFTPSLIQSFHSIKLAEHWLKEQGVYLDAQGIY